MKLNEDWEILVKQSELVGFKRITTPLGAIIQSPKPCTLAGVSIGIYSWFSITREVMSDSAELTRFIEFVKRWS